MTERKRVSLNLSGFQPRDEPPPPLPAEETRDIAERAGFTTRHAAPSSLSARVRSRKLIRVPVDVPEEIRDWLRDEAYRRNITIRAIILDGLRLQGAPVQEVDLVDRRRADIG